MIDAALAHGLVIGGIGGYQLGADARGGVIVGYGKTAEASIREGVLILRRVFDELRGASGRS